MQQVTDDKSIGELRVGRGWIVDLRRMKRKMVKIVHASIVIGVIVIMGLTSLL